MMKRVVAKVGPVLGEARRHCTCTSVARSVQTGGSDEAGGRRFVGVFELDQRAGSTVPKGSEQAEAIVKRLLGRCPVWRSTSTRSLPIEDTLDIMRLQNTLPTATMGHRSWLRTLAVFRTLIQHQKIIDATTYSTLLRTISMKHPELKLKPKQIKALLEDVLMAAAATFEHNPVPLFEKILKMYIQACIGLEVQSGLPAACVVISSIRIPERFSLKPVNERYLPSEHRARGTSNAELLSASLETFTTSMFHLAEKWNTVAFQSRKVRVITKSGRKVVRKTVTSKYHRKMLSELQTVFNALEAKTALMSHNMSCQNVYIGVAHPGAPYSGLPVLEEAGNQINGNGGNEQPLGAITKDPTITPNTESFDDDDDTIPLAPRYKRPFKRTPKLPNPDSF